MADAGVRHGQCLGEGEEGEAGGAVSRRVLAEEEPAGEGQAPAPARGEDTPTLTHPAGGQQWGAALGRGGLQLDI